MAVLYSLTFPQWFSPFYPITEPAKPVPPSRTIITKREVLEKQVYVEGRDIPSLMDYLSDFDQDYYIIKQDNLDCISIYRVDEMEQYLEDKEYDKKCKDHDRNMREYDKLYKEYQYRLKKYPELLARYEEAKLRDELEKLEDSLMEKEIIYTELEYSIKNMKKRELELKKLLSSFIYTGNDKDVF